MLAVFHVCAEFMLSDGTKFTVGTKKRNLFLDVPEEVYDSELFGALVNDGSVETAETREEKKRLGMEPTAGVTPEGKKVTVKNTVKVSAKKAGAEEKKQTAGVKLELSEPASTKPAEEEKK